jgi:hypothetical protein
MVKRSTSVWYRFGRCQVLVTGFVDIFRIARSPCLDLFTLYVVATLNSHTIFFWCMAFLFWWFPLLWLVFFGLARFQPRCMYSPRDSHPDGFCRCRLRDDMSVLNLSRKKNAYSCPVSIRKETVRTIPVRPYHIRVAVLALVKGVAVVYIITYY